MPPTIADRVRHILESILLIEAALARKSFEEFSRDLLLRSAIETLLEKISEASRYVPSSVKGTAPNIEWRKAADLGNRLRPAYREVEPTIVWSIVKDDLAPLQDVLEKILEQQAHSSDPRGTGGDHDTPVRS